MSPFTVPAFLPVPDRVTIGRLKLASLTRRVPGSISHTGVWYEVGRGDGGVMIVLVEATGPDALLDEQVIASLESALANGTGLTNLQTPGELLDEIRQLLGWHYATSGIGCGGQAVLVQPAQGRFQAAFAGGIIPHHVGVGNWDEIPLPLVSFPLLGVPTQDVEPGYPGGEAALEPGHRYFTSTDGLFPEAPLPGLGPIGLLQFLNIQPEMPAEALVRAVLAEAARRNGADWPAMETAALAWRIVA